VKGRVWPEGSATQIRLRSKSLTSHIAAVIFGAREEAKSNPHNDYSMGVWSSVRRYGDQNPVLLAAWVSRSLLWKVSRSKPKICFSDVGKPGDGRHLDNDAICRGSNSESPWLSYVPIRQEDPREKVYVLVNQCGIKPKKRP
jgi:hypothetical protein